MSFQGNFSETYLLRQRPQMQEDEIKENIIIKVTLPKLTCREEMRTLTDEMDSEMTPLTFDVCVNRLSLTIVHGLQCPLWHYL